MSDLEFFSGECYGSREMVEDKWFFKFQGNGFLRGMLRFSSWMLGKNMRTNTTRVDLGMLGFSFQVKVKFWDFQ